jgi:hypothetical protein
MRLLLIDAKEFSYLPSHPSKKVDVHFKEGIEKKNEYHNCLLAQIAFESKDGKRVVRRAASAIRRLAEELRVTSVVLLPNVHLTEHPMRSDDALARFKSLWRSLDGTFPCSVHLEPFGYSGEWRLIAKGHLRSVIGREFR